MASRVDSLQDIFGPSESTKEQQPERTAANASTIVNNDDVDFDDIFGGSKDEDGDEDEAANAQKPEEAASSSAVPGRTSAGAVASSNFDDIFGDAPPAPPATKKSEASSSTAQADSGSAKQPGDNATTGSSSKVEASTRSDKGGAEADARRGAEEGDKEFLDFLYEGEDGGLNKAAATAAAPAAAAMPTSTKLAPAVDGNPEDSVPPPEPVNQEDGSFLGTPASPEEMESPARAPLETSQFDSVTLLDPEVVDQVAHNNDDASSWQTENMPVQEQQSGSSLSTPAPAPSTAAPVPSATATAAESFVRKERIAVLRPLPEDPAGALRQLVLDDGRTGEEACVEEGPEDSGGTTAEDVGYVRRLCAATGGFLPPDLRPSAWSLLLGLGREPVDVGFNRWREEVREDPSASVAVVANKLDLRNDSLALARRLCEKGQDGEEGVEASAAQEEEEEEAGSVRDPEALAVDIEEVRLVCFVWWTVSMYRVLKIDREVARVVFLGACRHCIM